MGIKTLFLIFVFSSSLAFAETRTYLVYRNHFPDDKYLDKISPQEYKRFIDTGKKSINEAGGQPFRITDYQLNYDGKYALWTVTGKDLDELQHMESMVNQGYIVLISSMDVVSEFIPQKGGNETRAINSGPLAAMPTDYYQISTYTVSESTP